ncbi:hypothetical protein N7537_006141 [Penicillium hordei]|uniref:Uncharacterized protein n=1 Tax=Penicillium hordei TaxID=40994 RepID=A0AAD6E7L5_9EURO|nr:uncharacterized protein N7537_006141 [Penicillium hordei]KAJ5603185.1 hypothetical protein N7537_006141 [Penicillium hordei]
MTNNKGIGVDRVEALQETRDRANDSIESANCFLEGKLYQTLEEQETVQGPVQYSKRPYAIVTWKDVLSEATTSGQFERQGNGIYWCRVKGSVVEMSTEDYHFIALGYPQRMMQPSYLSWAQKEKGTAGAVIKQEVRAANAAIETINSAAPDPTRSSIASDILHRSEKSTMMTYQAEISRLRANRRGSGFQSRRNQGFLA